MKTSLPSLRYEVGKNVDTLIFSFMERIHTPLFSIGLLVAQIRLFLQIKWGKKQNAKQDHTTSD